MKISSTHLKKAALVLALTVVVGGLTAYAQTFTEPAGSPPSSSVSTLLNTGSGNQTMTGQLWANSVGANTFSIGTYLWDLEGSLTTIHIQQLCLSGSACITSFPTVTPPVNIVTNGGTCKNGWCAPDAFTAAKVCLMSGYTHLTGTVGGGSGGKVCHWNNAITDFTCDSSCTTSCSSRTLTQVSCDNNGTSRLQ